MGGDVVTPASWPREQPLDEKLLVVEPDRCHGNDSRGGRWRDTQVRDLPRFLAAGDLVVVNDAATLPASLRATAPGSSAGGGVRSSVRVRQSPSPKSTARHRSPPR